jgi:hypothetical protein
MWFDKEELKCYNTNMFLQSVLQFLSAIPPIITQIIGVGAVVLFLCSYLQKKRQNIIVLNVISRILYILQYVLLGAFSGAILDIMAVFSSTIASKRDKSKFVQNNVVAIVIVVDLIMIAVGVTLAVINQSVLDLLPVAGVILHTSAFYIKSEKKIRIVSLLGSPFWFVYNFLSHAYGSAVGDILSMVSIVIAMIRYRNDKPEQMQSVAKSEEGEN